MSGAENAPGRSRTAPGLVEGAGPGWDYPAQGLGQGSSRSLRGAPGWRVPTPDPDLSSFCFQPMTLVL